MKSLDPLWSWGLEAMCRLFDVYRVYPDSLEELRYTFSIRNKRHHAAAVFMYCNVMMEPQL